ncbi:YlbF family regulator [Paenactinomyces guangxiensis]|uniref:UPF0342 protein H1191_13150 n=1 Tax=Paenactinomyces guangxiensis TaxID=1490290 RepID=A0A7W1WSN9_9BACL|nr:YlbF family regulator [Paenactinomyces guangxiensis]MBA4495253.1 YlbF family regulator [Paenactinomyces guangxiensis]MBH8592337.1 YlbF family regulator [Paenactinomyces guangxiensis]
MANPYDHAHELARSIRASDVYQQLKEIQTEIKNNPTHQEMLDTFRRKQQEYQAYMMQGKEPTAEMTEQLQTLMTAIQGIPALTKYLQAEERLGVLLNDIQRILMEPVDELLGKREES